MADRKKKALLIVNPCAGKTKSRAGTFEIVDKFSKGDYEFSIQTTTCQGDATNIVKRELDGKDMVVCCGGDGTLNETINGVMDMPRRVPIGYIPTGTTNDLATSLGLPSDINKATDIIMEGHTNDYDVGLFNNRCFTYVASFGPFSRASYATPQKYKNMFGHAAYIAAAVPEVADIHPTKMRIEHDGGIIEGEFMFGAVSNSLSVGGFFKLPKEEVKFNDGVFEVLLVPKIKMTRLFHILHKVRSQNYDGKEIIFFKTSKIKITAPDENVPWTLDGEFGGNHHNVSIHVLERAVEIYSPENPLFLPRTEPLPVFEEETEAKPERRFRRKNKAEKASEPAPEVTAEEPATVQAQKTAETEEPEAEEIKAEDNKSEGRRFKRKNKAEKNVADTAAEGTAEQEPIETK